MKISPTKCQAITPILCKNFKKINPISPISIKIFVFYINDIGKLNYMTCQSNLVIPARLGKENLAGISKIPLAQ
ncbi:hypothetical protein BpHYR1_000674 [Brachionus plicatilis]|uniref:Uncharacterized protein n=1 Tax=Brachionus plicatilis TaxID=10195 RepID=A0A3M7R7E6_BRAPC|nr:hypothetical protein BpHYR1_000674 [Brachionus plicatilis]